MKGLFSSLFKYIFIIILCLNVIALLFSNVYSKDNIVSFEFFSNHINDLKSNTNNIISNIDDIIGSIKDLDKGYLEITGIDKVDIVLDQLFATRLIYSTMLKLLKGFLLIFRFLVSSVNVVVQVLVFAENVLSGVFA